LDSTAREYDLSLRAVCEDLGIELKELSDWNCCGASAGHATSAKISLALPSRNLAIAEQEAAQLAVSCPACFLRLKKADYEFKHSPQARREILEVIKRPYGGKVKIRHILEILHRDVGLLEIAKKVKKRLTGLKVASYYGCLLVRPPEVTCFDDPENPTMMDEMVEALGCEAVDWSGKVDCCGAGLALTRTDIVSHLVEEVTGAARTAGVHAIVCACPLCQVNLDTRQRGADPIPVFYFSELLGLAFSLPGSRKWFRKHLVRPERLLTNLTLM
jgi:heterodisulfide reductase subunit B